MSAEVAATDPIAELFRVLGHPVRVAILRHLGSGERAVGEIASATGITLSTLSQQLAILRKADLVTTRRDAKQVFYSLNQACFARISGAVRDLCPSLDSAGPACPDVPAGRVGAAMFARVERRG